MGLTSLAERRLQRLASRNPQDNRISYGCINVPAAFYDTQLRPRFNAGQGTLYLLPETRSLRTLLQPLLQSPTPR